jgi:PAS domain S-box-containing protein
MAQASLTAVGAIVGAVAVWKTKKHYGVFNRFWNWQIAVSGALTAAGIARSVSLMTGQGVVAQGAAAGFVMVAGALATSAVVSMTRLRSRHSRTSWATVADAFLITAAFGMVVWTMIMVPYFSSEVLSRTQIVFAVTLSSMAIVQFALTVFTMLSGGRHNVSWNVLIVACIAALGGLFAMLLEVTGIIAATNYSIAVAFLTAAAGLATAAAFHPDMRTILDAVTPTHRTSPPRLFALALAVLTPPVTIVITTTQTRQLDNVMWLGPSWAAITALLMFRFGEMIYARERSARLERILAVGASRLGNCTTRNEICELTANIILELAERESGVRAAVVTRSADGWLMTALPASAHRFPDEATFELLMEAGSATRGFLPFEDATGPSSLETTQGVRTRRRNGTLIADAEDLSDDVLFSAVNSRPLTQEPPRRRNGAINAESWIGVRYLAKNQPMGVLLLVSDMQLSHAVEDAMASLANNVSLALEAASLSEHLHLQRSDRRFRALVEHSRDVIVVINAQGKTSFRSPAAEELFSRHAGHEQLLELLAPGDRQGFYELIRDVWSGNRSLGMVEGRIEVDENTTNWYEFTITDMRENDEIGGLVINGRDITERKSLEADLRHRAMHDDLTALPNRAYLRGRLGRAMAHSSRTGGMVAAMFIDLDDFKVVNDG